MLRGFSALILCLAAPAAFAADMPANAAQALGARPLVLAHRGASGYLPEHTIEAYTRAIEQGADYIETDLVVTQDGYLIARHENELSTTTDVAERYPSRKAKKTIDGKEIEGWFSEDFTLDEISTIRAKQPIASRDQTHNHEYHIPTIAEVLTLRAAKQRETGRTIGVYIETKHPGYFRSISRPMEPSLMSILIAWALDRPGSPIFLESFEPESLRRMRERTTGPVVQLLSEPSQATDANLATIAVYANVIGPDKNMILPVDAKGSIGAPTDLIARAHKAGLLVHAYTFRPEKEFLPAAYGGDPSKEYCRFQSLGVDGVFTDTPDLALKAFRDSCPTNKPAAAK